MNKKLLLGLIALLITAGGIYWFLLDKDELSNLSDEWISIRYGNLPLQLSKLRPEGILAIGVEDRLNPFPQIDGDLLTATNEFVKRVENESLSDNRMLMKDFLSRIQFERERIEIALDHPEAFVWGEEYAPAIILPASLYYYHPIRSREDATRYINRLAQVDTYIQQYTNYLSKLSKEGYTPHPWVLEHQVSLIDSLLQENLRENVFYAGFQRKVNQVNYVYVNENDILTYLEKIIQLLNREIYPSFLNLKQFLLAWKEKGASGSFQTEGFQDMQYYYTSRRLDDSPSWDAFLDSIQVSHDNLSPLKENIVESPQEDDPVNVLENLVREIRVEEGKADLYTSGLFEEEFSFYTRISLLPDYLSYSKGNIQFEYGSLDTVRRSLLYIHPSYKQDHALSASQLAFRILSRGEQTACIYPYYQDSSLIQAARAFSYPAFSNGWGWYMYEIIHSQLDLFAGNKAEQQVFKEAAFRECLKWNIEKALHLEGVSPEELLARLSTHPNISQTRLKEYITLSLETPGKLSSDLVGWFSWNQLREKAREKAGRNFVLQAFHQAMLADGVLPYNRLNLKLE